MKYYKKKDILSLNGTELKKIILKLGYKSYLAQQIFFSLHKQRINNIQNIIHIPKPLRNILISSYKIYSPKIIKIMTSKDDTRKYIFKCFDGHIIESVLICGFSQSKKCTICISSQIGCAMDCSFCATGKNKIIRNLLPSEIIGQIYEVLTNLHNIHWPQQYFNNKYIKNMRIIHNIVYMGMGEPLHNYKNVIRSINLLKHQHGQLYSSKNITVSTSGIIKNIIKLGHETNVQLAISLNAPNNIIRTKIMPINKKWNIASLMEICKKYPLKNNQKITVEYVLIKNINDNNKHAMELVCLMKKLLNIKINLIPYNPHIYSAFQTPTYTQIIKFQNILLNNNLTTFIRQARGIDINAACGLLINKNIESQNI